MKPVAPQLICLFSSPLSQWSRKSDFWGRTRQHDSKDFLGLEDVPTLPHEADDSLSVWRGFRSARYAQNNHEANPLQLVGRLSLAQKLI